MIRNQIKIKLCDNQSKFQIRVGQGRVLCDRERLLNVENMLLSVTLRDICIKLYLEDVTQHLKQHVKKLNLMGLFQCPSVCVVFMCHMIFFDTI